MKNSKRLLSIDRFRGFIVFCMCFFICAAEFPSLGILSRFANNSASGKIMLFDGMSLADLVNPIFIFLISLSYQASFDRRYEKVKNKAYFHFLFRYLVFMGIGSIMVSGEYFFAHNGKDPYFFMTILMGIAVLFILLNLILKFMPKIPMKFKEKCKKLMYGTLILMGVIGIIFGIRDDIIIFSGSNIVLYKHWSILHEIGFTGLLALLFMKFDLNKKIISWFTLLVSYTLIQIIPGMILNFDIVVLGGLAGTLGWLIIMLGGIILMEFFRKKEYKSYIISCLILAFLSFISIKMLPINTSAVTSNYMLFSLLISSIIFGILNLFNQKELKVEFFVWWGRNPIIIFYTYLIFRLIEKIWAPGIDTSFLVAFLYTFGTTGFLTILAYLLYKKNIIIKL